MWNPLQGRCVIITDPEYWRIQAAISSPAELATLPTATFPSNLLVGKKKREEREDCPTDQVWNLLTQECEHSTQLKRMKRFGNYHQNFPFRICPVGQRSVGLKCISFTWKCQDGQVWSVDRQQCEMDRDGRRPSARLPPSQPHSKCKIGHVWNLLLEECVPLSSPDDFYDYDYETEPVKITERPEASSYPIHHPTSDPISEKCEKGGFWSPLLKRCVFEDEAVLSPFDGYL